jgi:hypothetical protein
VAQPAASSTTTSTAAPSPGCADSLLDRLEAPVRGFEQANGRELVATGPAAEHAHAEKRRSDVACQEDLLALVAQALTSAASRFQAASQLWSDLEGTFAAMKQRKAASQADAELALLIEEQASARVAEVATNAEEDLPKRRTSKILSHSRLQS